MDVTYSTDCGDFEWDSRKEASNRRKHGIAFADAAAVFRDARRILLYDSVHSGDEDRYILVGRLKELYVAVVVFTERGTRYRIISARLATKNEVKRYERQLS